MPKLYTKIINTFNNLDSQKGRERIKIRFINRTTLPIARLFNGYVPWLPNFIAIEPTHRCNLNCPICARAYWDKQKVKSGDMSMEVFDQIVPYFSERVTVSPQMIGEPLLAPSFFEMVRIIKKHSSTVVFNTNGTLLTPRNCELLVKEKVDTIAISMDGIKTLKNIRGIDIEDIIVGLENINRVKSKLNSNSPRLAIAFLGMRRNIDELPDIVEFAAKHKIAGIQVIHPVIYSDKLINDSLFLHKKLALHYFELAEKRAEELKIGLSLPPLEEKEELCLQPFNSLWISWNGDVRPCCASTAHEKKSIIIGNVKNSSLKKLWNNEKMRKLRLGLLGLAPLSEHCKNCPVRKTAVESFNRVSELI